MKIKFLLLVTVLISLAFSACKKKSDPDLTKAFIKFYGGIENDEAVDMAITPDGGFVILGTTRTEGNGGSDMIVVKADNAGNEEWRKTFGGPYDDYAGGIEVTPTGGFVIAGTRSFKPNVFDPRNDETELEAIRLDAGGNILWDSTFEYAGIFSPFYIEIGEQGVDVQNTPDGGFIFLGTVDSAKIYDTYALKLDAAGNRTDADYKFGTFGEDDFPSKIAVTSTGEFIYSCSTFRTNYTPVFAHFKASAGQLNNIVTSRDNQSFFDQTLATGAEIIQTGGDNYVAVGTTYTYQGIVGVPQDIYFIKLDNLLGQVGSIIKYGSSGTQEEGIAVSKTNDGGFIILGTTNDESLIGAPEKKKDILVIKVDANGGEQWKKTFGGIGDDKALAIKQTSDNGYIICATIDFGNNNDNSDKSNTITLIKVNSEGELNNE